MFERGGLQPGETLLIHGGSSGIGTMATQLAKAFGSKVIVTVGSQDKAEACRKLGADRAVNYKSEDFVAEANAFTDNAGVNIISTWSAATTSSATTTPPRSAAASCRSRFSARPRPPSISPS